MYDFWVGTLHVLQPLNFCGLTFGVFLGILFGVIPGLNAATAIVLIIPFSFTMPPELAFLMMIGAYCGAMFGGSIPAILFNVPGTPTSIMTMLDGHQLAKKGRGAEAISVANIAGVIGGLLSALVLVLMAPALAKIALKFGAPEYFALAIFGISAITSLGAGNQLRSLVSCALGLIVVTIGIDPVTGVERFTFGIGELTSGVDFITAMIGLFGISEVLIQAEKRNPSILLAQEKIKMKLPRLIELWRMKGTLLFSSLIGIAIGILPGEGGTVAAVLAYNETKRWSKHPEKFGTGIMEGVAAPECADNASTGGAMVPTLALGIPGSGTTAVMLGAFYIYGLTPGPLLFISNRELVYTIFSGMFFANVIQGIMAIFVTRYFALALKLKYSILGPSIVLFSIIGSFAIRNNIFDVVEMSAFGLLGYLMVKFGFPLTPMIIGMVLGPLAEINLARSMIMLSNNPLGFFTRPISGLILAFSIISFAYPLLSKAVMRIVRR